MKFITVLLATCVFGDNGVVLGYKNGAENVRVITLVENPNSAGSQIFIEKQISMDNNKITAVSDIFTGATVGRYYHEGWCGSLEKTAKRVSNLNVTLSSGIYAFGEGANGAPCTYGTLIHIKWGFESIAPCTQLVIDVTNGSAIYVRATEQSGAVWGAWTQNRGDVMNKIL